MQMIMFRMVAIREIAKRAIKHMPSSEREEIIACSFLSGYDFDDEELMGYSEDLRREIASGRQEVESDDSRYDPILIDLIELSYVGVKNEYILQELNKIFPLEREIVGSSEVMFACPCCGYATLFERGSYDICKVCFWEDDGVSDPQEYSGPNHQTLEEGQANFIKIGACDVAALKHVDPKGRDKYMFEPSAI